MATTKSHALVATLAVLALFLVAGCYTQIAKVRVESEATSYDEYEERYVEEDTSAVATADSTVYHRVDVYHHGLYGRPYFVYDPWWYWWDPYYNYPWRFYFGWRVHYYWDPWYSWYPYWGDPWYWTPFSYYGGWAYYGPSWGWYYYHPRYPRYWYWEETYARRPFQRRTMVAGGGMGAQQTAPPMTAVSGTRTRSPHEGVGSGQELARPVRDPRRTTEGRGETLPTRRVARDERNPNAPDQGRRIAREDATPARQVKRDSDIARRVPRSAPPASAPAKPAETKSAPRQHQRTSNSPPPARSAPQPSYSPPRSYSPPPSSHSGSSSGSSGRSRQSSGSGRTRSRS
ncbi:MAG: hypothetical protein H5U38_15005 [Calditrichaeota bacterium]|nr:hypothetical protein [Calditrichota bacterium]